ncbi:ribose-phosphate diphosphokinase [Actinotignum sp. GS-2025f]|uniref:ribose-phosphate diphosphokinase n=1 Tax=Actinotignum TaxID=1653174 RepID=UPI00237DE43D|nr:MULTISPECIES: ribose-phosphate diphosphokinase [Actinotignum]MDK6787645.1 ribose-phosphate diphosphokinase [Actinotignum timonense]MDE1655323.1 ribose-phosphate diphosphokinase [Actinotignum schaalii]MDK8285993.1 ribose-phosphate diphosphokinase [Actinotignum sanguinis]MDK8650486.1 ribose-phosphate diphosphokinase [Actinotignum sanguinis]MDK8800845.1 ribose-phosphate diphosphokinase [Actinotignum sanguinis]
MSTGMRVSNDKRLVLATGRAYPELAEEVARCLHISMLPTTIYDFANSEIYIRYEESIRGADVFIMQAFSSPINKWLMETLLMVDAAKRASAKRITVVAPYYPYARQDKKHKGREPISARLVADLLKTAGANRIMSVDLHAAQSQGFFDGPVDHLWAMPTLVEYVRSIITGDDAVMVSPDAGRIKVAEQWSSRLGGIPLAFVHKTRNIEKANSAKANRVVGDVAGKTAIIVDDMIDTAGTLVGAIRVVKDAGAKDVIVAATHALLSGEAVERLSNAPIRELVVTDTVPIPDEKRFKGLTVLSIAPTLARAIDEVFEDGSVTSLFDGAY